MSGWSFSGLAPRRPWIGGRAAFGVAHGPTIGPVTARSKLEEAPIRRRVELSRVRAPGAGLDQIAGSVTRGLDSLLSSRRSGPPSGDAFETTSRGAASG